LGSKRIVVTSLTFRCDVIGQVAISFRTGHFLLVVLWNQASISNGFRDIIWRMWHNSWRGLTGPL